ncbi:MAG: IS1182 family transposase [Thiomonas sp.]
MNNITNEAGTNGHTGALFGGLAVPADSAAVLKRSKPQGAPRVQSAVRNQVEWRACDLDSTLPADHQARAVWAFVQSLDLHALYEQIRAVEGHVGRAPIDPAILMGLWLYATLDGVGSARELGRLCDRDDAYRWLCGGVGVNHHTLGDFRVEHAQWLDGQLTRSVAGLLSQGLVSMNRVAHDGMRVRAQAGAASFRRRETLEQLMQDAQAQVQALKQEVGDDPGAGTRRVRAARQRAATEREQRIARAIEAMAEIDKSLSGKGKKARANSTQADRAQDEPAQPQAAPTTQPVGEQCAEEQPNEARRAKKPKQPRVSTTDHEARVMKMADGGFRPAFNAQLAVDTATLIITGVELINSGSDMNQMRPMHAQHQDRYGQVPAQWLTDGGFAQHAHIEELDARATQVFAPVVAPKDPQRDRYAALPGDSHALGQWRQRMGTEAAKRIYKQRAASIECTNAHLRNRGLQRFNVRGMIKARAVLLWHALAHNLKRMMALNIAFAP